MPPKKAPAARAFSPRGRGLPVTRKYRIIASHNEAILSHNRFIFASCGDTPLPGEDSMTAYIWQHAQWPMFRWDSERLLVPLARARKTQGRALALMARLGLADGLEAWSAILEEDAVQTAAIEGEILDRADVRSSIAEHLGLARRGLRVPDRRIDGLVRVLCDAARRHDVPLDAERLKAWHASLFPDGSSGLHPVHAGVWRQAPMRIVSGPIGREVIHFEAPGPERLDWEMTRFFAWWNSSLAELDGVIRSALAHLYFVTIHPFDDGNGRLARAIADMALAQDEKTPGRFYSISAQTMKERSAYYEALEKTQKGDLDCTEWLLWFLGCFERSVEAAMRTARSAAFKGIFWDAFREQTLSEHQRKAVNRLLDAGKGGFEGGLSTRKYMGMTRVSRATAWRDIDDLIRKGLLRPLPARGRSTAYEINWDLALPHDAPGDGSDTAPHDARGKPPDEADGERTGKDA